MGKCQTAPLFSQLCKPEQLSQPENGDSIIVYLLCDQLHTVLAYKWSSLHIISEQNSSVNYPVTLRKLLDFKNWIILVYLCIHVFVRMCAGVHVGVHRHVCALVCGGQRLMSGVSCNCSLFIEAESLAEPGAHSGQSSQLTHTGDHALTSTSEALGLQVAIMSFGRIQTVVFTLVQHMLYSLNYIATNYTAYSYHPQDCTFSNGLQKEQKILN